MEETSKVEVAGKATAKYGWAFRYNCLICKEKQKPLFGSGMIKHLVNKHDLSKGDALDVLHHSVTEYERKSQ